MSSARSTQQHKRCMQPGRVAGSAAKGMMGPLSLSRAQRAERDTSGRVQRDNRGSRGSQTQGRAERSGLKSGSLRAWGYSKSK